ncbi:YifB family Mg chelatase-like AAA ATPase [Helicobacter kayseriensis]|uniref:YifB family Mg chelatase-like AAA ATPase n=1 Tax=Helicobacter kayseriensis TaxID=2905877 RepID=UPI001E30AD23|nr:YifB family Mg chelatase-like AAA ATPase [Helicobacter kayseriensis]MCE3047736.1 YifB family Mg chelatase-like AAA ATPase [Helicobacter kayseriensis]MCE3049113.1 YifB family Mg chelatase-like AAA ATPase [Helicobacter kayseriensis]
MSNTIFCATRFGSGAKIVAVEGVFARGLPNFHITGLANHAILEAKHRVQSALQACKISMPPMKFIINLSPADLPKSGSHFDLPIALLGALQKQELKNEWFAFGELGLDGALKSQESIFPLLLQIALLKPNAKIILPKGGEEIFSLIPSLEFYFVSSLQEAFELITLDELPLPYHSKNIEFSFVEIGGKKYYYSSEIECDFYDVIGQDIAKRAALIAASGFHNIVFEGSPGCGKSMIAKRMRYIMPPMSLEEMIECMKLQALSHNKIIYSPMRPFRNPHQSASKASILGSATALEAKVGEIALAHQGILFFDELLHFKKEILESLREPLENNSLVISRVHSKIEYETSFLFVGAQNPCPCGNLLSTSRECRCQDKEIANYKNRLSEPFWDRMDLFVQMSDHLASQSRISSQEMREKVFLAFAKQKERGQKIPNGKLDEKGIEQFCPLDQECSDFLLRAMEKLGMSYRGTHRLRRVARTIADLEGSERICKTHLIEAIGYRKI